MTKHTTYTLLLTIAHDDGAAPSTELLETMVQRGLEEGVRDVAGIYSAQASAMVGDKLPGQAGPHGMSAIKRLHAELRA